MLDVRSVPAFSFLQKVEKRFPRSLRSHPFLLIQDLLFELLNFTFYRTANSNGFKVIAGGWTAAKNNGNPVSNKHCHCIGCCACIDVNHFKIFLWDQINGYHHTKHAQIWCSCYSIKLSVAYALKRWKWSFMNLIGLEPVSKCIVVVSPTAAVHKLPKHQSVIG